MASPLAAEIGGPPQGYYLLSKPIRKRGPTQSELVDQVDRDDMANSSTIFDVSIKELTEEVSDLVDNYSSQEDCDNLCDGNRETWHDCEDEGGLHYCGGYPKIIQSSGKVIFDKKTFSAAEIERLKTLHGENTDTTWSIFEQADAAACSGETKMFEEQPMQVEPMLEGTLRQTSVRRQRPGQEEVQRTGMRQESR